MLWLVVGFVAGLCVSYFWPHEPALATATDRTDKFLMTTVHVKPDMEAVFVLDFLTGQLTGAALNKQAPKTQFVWYYQRSIADDFQVDPEAKPNYAIVSGVANFPNRGRMQFGDGALYVAEMSSGMVQCYAIPYQITQRVQPVVTLVPVHHFQFREK